MLTAPPAKLFFSAYYDDKVRTTHFQIRQGTERYCFATKHIHFITQNEDFVAIVYDERSEMFHLSSVSAAKDFYDVLTELMIPDPDCEVEELAFGEEEKETEK